MLAQTQIRRFAFDLEGLLVRRTECSNHAIDRQLHFVALEPFLQFSLGVLGRRFHTWIDFDGYVKTLHERLSSSKPGIKIDSTDDGFECVGQDRWPIRST